MIQKGKRLIKNGIVTESEFKELSMPPSAAISGAAPIEMRLENGRVVSFSQVETLIEFMKKSS